MTRFNTAVSTDSLENTEQKQSKTPHHLIDKRVTRMSQTPPYDKLQATYTNILGCSREAKKKSNNYCLKAANSLELLESDLVFGRVCAPQGL